LHIKHRFKGKKPKPEYSSRQEDIYFEKLSQISSKPNNRMSCRAVTIVSDGRGLVVGPGGDRGW